MSDLTAIDKIRLEKIFGMRSGYVLRLSRLDFSFFYYRHNQN